MSDSIGSGAPVAPPSTEFSACSSACARDGVDACCVFHGCAAACVKTGRLHVDPVEAILLDTCTTELPCLVRVPQRAYDDMRAICAVGGRPWCAHLEAIRRDRASELALAVAMLFATVCAIILVRRMAARRAALLRLNAR